MSLSPKQIQSIGLLSTGMSQKLVAESLGLSVRTLQRWQKLPEFLQALESAQVHQITPKKTAEIASEVVKDAWSRRDELRAKEIDLLDMLQDFLMKDLEENKNHRAIDRLIKISQTRAALLGLNIKNHNSLDAIEILLHEQILSAAQAGIVFEGIQNIEQGLRIIEAQNDESRQENNAIKNLTTEQLAQEYRNLIDKSY